MTYSTFYYSNKRMPAIGSSLGGVLTLNNSLCRSDVAYLPRCHDDRLFISYLDGSVHCVDMKGIVIWKRKFSKRFKKILSCNGQTAIADGILYAFYDDRLHLLHCTNGDIIDAVDVPETILENSIIHNGSLIYLSSTDDSLTLARFSTEDKKNLWQIPITDDRVAMYVIAGDADYCYFADTEKSMSCVSLSSGTPLWRHDCGKSMVKQPDDYRLSRMPIICGESVIIPIIYNHIIALDRKNGKRRWFTELDINITDHASPYPDGSLHLIDNTRYAQIDVGTGRILRTHHFGKALIERNVSWVTRSAVTDTSIYLGDISKGTLVCIDRNDFAVSWETTIKGQIPLHQGPVIINETLFVLSHTGDLWAYNKK